MSCYQKHFLRVMVAVLSIIYLSVISKFDVINLSPFPLISPTLTVGLDKRCFVKCVPIRNSSFRCTDLCQVLWPDFSVEFRMPPSHQDSAKESLPCSENCAIKEDGFQGTTQKARYDMSIYHVIACQESLGHILAAPLKAWESGVFRLGSPFTLGRDML